MAHIICGVIGLILLGTSPYITNVRGPKAERITQVVANMFGGACLIAAVLS